jgi:hypothetical protein
MTTYTQAPANGNRRVDDHHPGMQRLLDHLTFDKFRGRLKQWSPQARVEWRLVVERVAKWIEEPPQDSRSNRQCGKTVQTAHAFPCSDLLGAGEQHHPYARASEIIRHTGGARVERHEFLVADTCQALHEGNAIAHLADDTPRAQASRQIQLLCGLVQGLHDGLHNVSHGAISPLV